MLGMRLLGHLKKHNARGRGWKYMPEESLVKLVTDNSPAEAMKAFLVKRKSSNDFDFFGGQRHRLCTLCSTNVDTFVFADHLRDHNKCGGFISPAEFEVMLEELPFSDIGRMLPRIPILNCNL